MARCWELRGCDKEMRGRCPHAMPGDICPATCAYAACKSERHAITIAPELIFTPEIDRTKAVKEGCRFCEYFLTKGPKVEPKGPKVEPKVERSCAERADSERTDSDGS